MSSLRFLRSDAALAGAAAVAITAATALLRPSGPVVTVALLGVGVALPVLVRRRWPLTAATASALVALVGMTIPGWTGHYVAMAMFCSAAYYRPRPWLLGGVAVGWFVLCGMSVGAEAQVRMIADAMLIGTAPVAAGYALRARHEHTVQAARLHRAEMRAALAREVHDAVGHHLTAIRLQATSARYVVRDPDPITDRALGTINELAGTALGEVRGLLDALNPAGPPPPRLEELEDLAAQLRTSRCAVRIERSGELADLPPPAEHGAFRIVQEALTNAVRHSGASRITVRLDRDGGVLRVRVEDNGCGDNGCGDNGRGDNGRGDNRRAGGAIVAGRGIAGMRERARQLGGTLAITRAGGWRVEAALPLNGVLP